MTKKALAVLLAFALLFGAAPLVCARPADEGWLVYCDETGENRYDVTVVAPAKYTRASDKALIETVDLTGHAETAVSAPTVGEILFYADGKTETRLTLAVSCAVNGSTPGYDVQFAVLPDSVLDAAGNGNARVFFEDETDYMSAGGYAGIDVTSNLLRRDYDYADDTVAVGDTLRVDYNGLYPVEIFINGEKAAAFPGGELEKYTCSVAETGALSVVVRQRGQTIAARHLTVVSSKEMYERNLRDGLITREDIPSTEDLIDVGVPAGSPFILIAKLIAFFNSLRIFFVRLFSFTRIA